MRFGTSALRQAIGFTVVGIVAGFGLAALFGRDQGFVAPPPVAIGGRPTEALADRLAALERALAAETAERAALEREVSALTVQIGTQQAAGPDAEPAPADVPFPIEAEEGGEPERFAARNAQRRERASPEYRRDRLVDAGFPPDQARWIVEREAEMRMAVLNAQYEARRDSQPYDPRSEQLAGQARLRADLGDDAYARYLDAMGMPTSVPVFEVLESSPAKSAGLQSGDEIVAYDGQRIFSVMELNRLTVAGEPGQTVAIDVLRDGQSIQLYVPRGPIGFTSGGRNFGFGPAPFIP